MSIRRQLVFMVRQEGLTGCFRGNLVNCVGGVPFNACEFFFYELAKNNLYPGKSKQDLNYGQKFLCGGLAGWVAQILVNPLGVIKTVYTVD